MSSLYHKMSNYALNRIAQMFQDGNMPMRGGQWIDLYNQATNPDVSGTVLTTIDSSNNYFVMEEDPKIVASRGRGDGWQQQLEERTDGITNTITGVQKDNMVHNNYRIRKLTPRECFRLMGVSEPDIDTLLSAGISNSQLYKLAGNSIVVNCLAAIFYQLFIGNQNKNQQLEIF